MKTIRQSILEKYTTDGKIRSHEKVVIDSVVYTIEYHIDYDEYKWFLKTEDGNRYSEILIGQ